MSTGNLSKQFVTGLLSLFLFVFWFMALRPTVLGGTATYIIVNGISMEPTYYDGDLIVLRKADDYVVGNVVAYPISDFYVKERFVIHRVIDRNEDGFVTQGDNRDIPDPWFPNRQQIIGRAWLHIPYLGHVFAFLREPWRLGVAAGVLMFLSMINIDFFAQKRKRHRRAVLDRRRKIRRGRKWPLYLS